MLTTIGSWMLVMKSSTVETLGEDYVTVARARGLPDRRIATAYVGRNAVLPLFTQLAISLGFVVGGSILVEQIFRYQGIGYLLFNAVNGRDYPVLQGIFLVITIAVVLANLLADLLYSRLDPRIRVGGRRGVTRRPSAPARWRHPTPTPRRAAVRPRQHLLKALTAQPGRLRRLRAGRADGADRPDRPVVHPGDLPTDINADLRCPPGRRATCWAPTTGQATS